MNCHSVNEAVSHAFQHFDFHSMASILTVLSFSFFASLHCGIMCGPLVCSQCLKVGSAGGTSAVIVKVIYYNFGRILSYSTAGAVLGYFSGQLQIFSSFWGRLLVLAMGTSIVVLGLVQLLDLRTPKELFGIQGSTLQSSKIFQIKILRFIQSVPEVLQSFLLGVVTVFFPCMTLTPALLAASSSEGAVQGGMLLLSFCLGTFPMMSVAPILPTWLFRFARSRYHKKIVSLLIILSGITVLFNMIGE